MSTALSVPLYASGHPQWLRYHRSRWHIGAQPADATSNGGCRHRCGVRSGTILHWLSLWRRWHSLHGLIRVFYPPHFLLVSFLRVVHLPLKLILLHQHVLVCFLELKLHDETVSLLLEDASLSAILLVKNHHVLAVLLRQCQVVPLHL